jgi:hypothetical protein
MRYVHHRSHSLKKFGTYLYFLCAWGHLKAMLIFIDLPVFGDEG